MKRFSQIASRGGPGCFLGFGAETAPGRMPQKYLIYNQI